jgi:DNA-binding transcriptional LysR family regulator
LLDRDRRRLVVLTDAGRAFLMHAREALESVEAATHHAREAARGNAGRLVIAGCGTLAPPVLAVHIKAFRKELPRVEVSFVEATQAEELAALKEGRAHLAISANFGRSLEAIFHIRELDPIVLVAVIPTSHPRACQPVAFLAPKDLDGETLLRPTPAGDPSYHEFLQELQQQTGLAPRGFHWVDGVENILHMVAAGYGIAVLPKKMVRNAPLGCRTRRLRLTPPGYRLWMVWLRDSGSAVLHKFLNLLVCRSP